MFGVHPDLRPHVALAFVSSALLGAVGVATIAAAALGKAPVPLWAAFGLAAVTLAVAWLGTVVNPRWYRESTRIVSSVQPLPGSARLRLEPDSDSTSLYARVEPSRAEGEIPLLLPRWDVRPLLDSDVPVSLYLHPRTSAVVALRTDRGLLWTIAARR